MKESEHGISVAAVTAAISAAGLDPATVRDALSAIDEVHLGGHRATLRLCEHLALSPQCRLLDIGCGLGGPARFFARRFGCRVIGIDREPAQVAVADYLTRLVGPDELVDFLSAGALNLPFGNATFEAATLLHVGMNVPDKAALFAEAARILVPGGTFLVYDVLRTGPGSLAYPVVWAQEVTRSFIASPDEYRSTLAETGFEIIATMDFSALALAMSQRLADRLAATSAACDPLSMRLVLGGDASVKIANMIANLEQGLMAPVMLLARRTPASCDDADIWFPSARV